MQSTKITGQGKWMSEEMANLFVQGELVVVKSGLPATASRTLRKGWFWPLSTIQKISLRALRTGAALCREDRLTLDCGLFDKTAAKTLP